MGPQIKAALVSKIGCHPDDLAITGITESRRLDSEGRLLQGGVNVDFEVAAAAGGDAAISQSITAMSNDTAGVVSAIKAEVAKDPSITVNLDNLTVAVSAPVAVEAGSLGSSTVVLSLLLALLPRFI